MGVVTGAPFRNTFALSFGAAIFALVLELPAALAILGPELQWAQYDLPTTAGLVGGLWFSLASLTLLLGWTILFALRE